MRSSEKYNHSNQTQEKASSACQSTRFISIESIAGYNQQGSHNEEPHKRDLHQVFIIQVPTRFVTINAIISAIIC